MLATPIDTTGTRSRFHVWGSKRDAAAALAALRVCGLNVADDIEIHPTRTRSVRGWTIGRPDHFHGITSLMTDAGTWVPGRLTDPSPCWCSTPCRGGHAAPWADLGRDLEPATFTHVTRTVPHWNRPERYRTKSNGSCGRYVRSDDSVALCTCGWKAHEDTREEARGAARVHRAEMAARGELAGASR